MYTSATLDAFSSDLAASAGWRDWACWIPGRSHDEPVTRSEPVARVTRLESRATRLVRADVPVQACAAAHNARRYCA